MSDQPFPYTLCGLDYVYLLNGFTLHETEYGNGFSIDNVEGLHAAIAEDIVRNRAHLSGQEIRFLRKEMDLAQQGLANWLGVDVQTVARWEKDEYDVHPTADRLIRFIWREVKQQTPEVLTLIARLNAIDDNGAHRRCFEETSEGWKAAA